MRHLPAFLWRTGNIRSLIVFGVALLAGAAAALSARQHIQGHVQRLDAEARTPVVSRVVAAHDLAPGTRLTADHLGTRDFPAPLAPIESVAPGRHARLLAQVLLTGLRAGGLVVPVHGPSVVHVPFLLH